MPLDHAADVPAAGSRLRPWLPIVALALLLVGCANKPNPAAPPAPQPAPPPEPRPAALAPELDGGVAWLNTAGPLHLRDLRGKFVLLDFWTLCCINCIHTLPEIDKLEKKYANELVVIGVHSPKFANERDTDSIRKAVLRYEVSHPVVNDADRRIWEAYDATAWPTLVLIDPEGRVVRKVEGEGVVGALDDQLAELIKQHRDRKTLNERPIKFELARNLENGHSPLFFPGKVLADADSRRLFIADSTHHRVVVTDLDGNKLAVIGGGVAGRADGDFEHARFNDPQGMALRDNVLYVADRKNHLIRAVDLGAHAVRTVAGTGQQGHDREAGDEAAALKVPLNSPWDLYLKGHQLFIAMAGSHQIWVLDLRKRELTRYAGRGAEDLRDGPLATALFAQPSGLSGDGGTLYVADSEVSAVRALPLSGRGEVRTLVGLGLFKFGDVDGVGDEVRLQHALGVCYHDGKLYVADTYNSKIKVLDPERRTCQTLVGGEPDGWLGMPVLNEPGGLSVAGDQLYVADTNAHRIRVVDLKTRAVRTLTLKGVEAPKAP